MKSSNNHFSILSLSHTHACACYTHLFLQENENFTHVCITVYTYACYMIQYACQEPFRVSTTTWYMRVYDITLKGEQTESFIFNHSAEKLYSLCHHQHYLPFHRVLVLPISCQPHQTFFSSYASLAFFVHFPNCCVLLEVVLSFSFSFHNNMLKVKEWFL